MSKVDIVEHELVPQHIVLSPEEEEAVLKKYNIDRNNLPLIKSTDPIIKALEEQLAEESENEEMVSLKGRIIKIIRNNSPAGEGVYYRYVIE
jgi:DNA-directed RNA polymerase subunit H